MFEVLHSSAGAGKTHALVRHYLTHSMRSEDASAYRQILALTFTNKAAAEMKERVLQYLEYLAAGTKEHAQIEDVIGHLQKKLHLDRDTVQARAKAVLGHMIHHWGDVAITTIDSFTRRVVRPFARDLQLDHDLRMTTEEEYYRDLAVDSLVSEVGGDPAITKLLTEACQQLLHEERKWDPEFPLQELSKELTKERSIRPLEELRDFPIAAILELSGRLRREENAWRGKARAIGRKAMRFIQDAGLGAEQLAHGKGGIFGYFRKLSEFQEEWPIAGTNARRPIETGKWHSSKASAQQVADVNAISGALTALYDEAETLAMNEYAAFLIRRAVGRELVPAFTLHSLNEHLWKVKQEDGVAFFSDLTRKVSEVVKEEPVSFIHERMGERYHHYLIDEFQDTSVLQWNALLPLIVNALDSGGSALLVGDAKQAIYRFRNGEVQLFTDLPKIHGRGDDTVEVERERTLERFYVKGTPLASNWRSASVIIDHNNALFAAMKPLLPERLQRVFEEHEQKDERKLPGLVHLRRSDGTFTGEDRSDEMLEFVLDHVQEAVRDGFPQGSIAVLTRSTRHGKTIAQHLIANGYAVLSPDGLQLSGDPVIELLIDLLRTLHSGDATAAARALQYQAQLEAEDGSIPVDPFRDVEGRLDPVECVRQWLRDHGAPRLRTTLSALIADLARAFDIKPAQDASVMTLLDAAHVFATQHGQDIGGFLEHWERTGEKLSVAAPENGQAVQIMTIHKAKGLQFPVVIVASTDMSGRGGHKDWAWIDPGEAVPDLPVALVKEGKGLRDLGLKELVKEEEDRRLDALNLLYVAFTRPEQRLYALVPGRGVDALNQVIISYMEQQGDGTIMELGERSGPWSIPEPRVNGSLNDVAGSSPFQDFAVRYEAPDNWDPMDPDPFRQAGNAIHEALARTSSAMDVAEALRSIAAEGMIKEQEADRLAQVLGPLLASESLRPWYGEGLVMRTEATLVDANGGSHRPDRVIIDGDVVRVLDIKTGKPSNRHHDQVRGYMALLKELGHERVEGALLYLPEGELTLVSA